MVVLTREQIEERLAALHRASLELVSDLSLEPLLERIVNLAREQVGAQYAALGVLDEEGRFEQFIPVGMSSEEIGKLEHPPVGKGLLGVFQESRHTVRVPKISADERSVGLPPNHPEMESFLGTPIILGDILLGQIYLTNKIGHPEFTTDDERVIETLAAYAAVAISNARLYRDLLEQDRALAQHNEDLALLNDVASALASSLELDDILDRTLSRVMSYLDVEAGEIFLSEEGGQEMKMALHKGEAPVAFWTKDRFRLGEGVIGRVAQTGKPVISSDLKQDVSFLRKAVTESGFLCLASIPLTARGNVVGVMNVVTRRERLFDKREIHLLTAIGSWAGTTIENARLHRQARRLAVLEERERIGMDLHDGIIQSIYAVGLALDYARMAIEDDPKQACLKIEQAIEGLNSTIGDIRSYISDLRPRQLGGKNLREGLQRLVEEFKTNTNLDAILTGPQDGLANLPVAQATALFHICQEALANIAKHARAKRAEVHLWTTKDRVLLEISDDGEGFDLRKMSVTLGHGLSNMHTRAYKVGGDVEITSEPGDGTTVLAWVPLLEA
ncbi:MAG: GAF domain-containing protein [Chloroflexota bacterium]|nr:MAG: GAF domain-containing protein [Chloroflexota bacterium]